jgi:hypothetical protein
MQRRQVIRLSACSGRQSVRGVLSQRPARATDGAPDGTLTVLDRGTPVAQIVPCPPEAIEVRRAVRWLRDLDRPPRPARRTDSVAVLIDDRSRRDRIYRHLGAAAAGPA